MGERTMLRHALLRSPSLKAIAVAAACLFSGIAQAGSLPQGSSYWQGQYAYPDGREPVVFIMTLDSAGDGSFTGDSEEPATFGNGSSPTLTATLDGATRGPLIRFTKTYDGSGGQTHSVEYEGKISNDGNSINGAWHLGSYGGTFQAWIAP